MATFSDKEELIERDVNNGLCLRILTCLTIVFVTVFMSVTFLVFLDIQSLDDQDTDLNLQIEELKRKLGLIQNGENDVSVDRDVIEEMVDGYLQAEEINNDQSTIHKRQTGNIFELILKAQEATFEKYCTNHNDTCPQGPRGDNGTNGLSGSPGKVGAAGPLGDKGSSGDSGINGFKGQDGSKGSQGDTGAAGNIGLHGQKGSQGDNGKKGSKGENGIDGSQGKPGMKGDTGDVGPKGPEGQDGVRGSKGFDGPQGYKGVNGSEGPVGPAGPDSKTLPDGCECYKKPSFLNPNDETILVNSVTDTDIPCNATGNPPPVVSLFKPPRKSGRKRDVQHTGNKYTVVKANVGDYGTYICTATNMYGSVTKTVNVMGTPQAN